MDVHMHAVPVCVAVQMCATGHDIAYAEVYRVCSIFAGFVFYRFPY